MVRESTIKIPAELFALAESSHYEGQLELPLLAAGPDDYAFAEPLDWQVDVTNTGEAFLVEGTVNGSATTACARCLEDVAVDLDARIDGYFLIEGQAEAPEGMDDDEYEVLPADHIIDLEPLIIAALMVELPSVPLCSDECKGLCPVCGANLNEGPCGCKDTALEEFETAANPFAALAGLTFDDE